MGMIGSLCGYAIYAPIRRRIPGPGGIVIAAMLAAWFSVLLASGAVAIELGLSEHRAQLLSILGWMVLVHAAIGVGEAIITGSVLGFILRTRPDLIAEVAAPSRPIRWVQVAGAGLLIALQAAGAAVGGVTGALIGLGMPEYAAKRYEEKLGQGNILLSVQARNDTEAQQVRQIFERDGAKDVAVV